MKTQQQQQHPVWSSQLGKEATSFIKDLAKRRRASGVCGCFSVCFGSGGGLLWTIHHHSSGIMLFKHTIAVNIVSSSRRRPRREHLLDLPVAMAHFAFQFDLRFAFIEDSTQCFGYLLVE